MNPILRTLLDLYQLRRNLHLKPSELERMQTEKLKRLVRHAYRNIPFYHERFMKAGVKPDDISTTEDLAKIPVITKSELQATPLSKMVPKDVDLNKCIRNKTSGSTGIPLVTLVDGRTAAFEGAVWLRALFENGLKLRDRRLIISDPRSIPTKRRHIGILNNEYLSIFDDAKKQLSVIEDYRPNIIQGYPSSIEILANARREYGSSVKPRLVFTLAELLHNGSRDLIRSSFETEVFDYYGSSELSLMAWECDEHDGYHMNADSVIMEFVDDVENPVSGERGEIVCTSLVNYTMPLIRYRVGDVGAAIGGQCSCGRRLPLMKILEGRADDFLLTLDGRSISPTVFFPYPFEHFEGIRQFRVIQERRDELMFQMTLKEGYDCEAQILEEARRKIHRLFGNDMRVKFEILEEIPRDTSGKLRKIISKIANTH